MTHEQAERAVVALELIALRLGQIVQAIATSDADDHGEGPPETDGPVRTKPFMPRTMDDAPLDQVANGT